MRALPLFFILLAGCATSADRGPSRDTQALARELAGRSAGQAQRCLSLSAQEGLQIVDESTLVVRRGKTIWVNRLASSCPGVRPLNTLIRESYGSEACAGDFVRGIEPAQSIPGPRCRLQEFVPYR